MQAEQTVGDFYMYNFYDTCGHGNQFDGSTVPSSGDSYPCGTDAAVAAFCNNEQVRTQFHMKPASFYGRPWNAQAFGNNDSMVYDKVHARL